jgi:hypothetical protein
LVITCAALGLLYSVMRFEHDGGFRVRPPAEEPEESRNLPNARATAGSARPVLSP